MSKIRKRGPGGIVESLGKKAIRGYLKEATEGKKVTKVPSLKFDRLKGSDTGVPGDPHLGEYNRDASGITLGKAEELDDMNARNEMRRKEKAETAPTPIRGEDSNLAKKMREEGYRRGGKIELGKPDGAKGKRRADKRARK